MVPRDRQPVGIQAPEEGIAGSAVRVLDIWAEVTVMHCKKRKLITVDVVVGVVLLDYLAAPQGVDD
jgi:hypothetical protein